MKPSRKKFAIIFLLILLAVLTVFVTISVINLNNSSVSVDTNLCVGLGGDCSGSVCCSPLICDQRSDGTSKCVASGTVDCTIEGQTIGEGSHCVNHTQYNCSAFGVVKEGCCNGATDVNGTCTVQTTPQPQNPPQNGTVGECGSCTPGGAVECSSGTCCSCGKCGGITKTCNAICGQNACSTNPPTQPPPTTNPPQNPPGNNPPPTTNLPGNNPPPTTNPPTTTPAQTPPPNSGTTVGSTGSTELPQTGVVGDYSQIIFGIIIVILGVSLIRVKKNVG